MTARNIQNLQLLRANPVPPLLAWDKGAVKLPVLLPVLGACLSDEVSVMPPCWQPSARSCLSLQRFYVVLENIFKADRRLSWLLENYCDHILGTTRAFHYSRMQLHSGAFPSSAIWRMPWKWQKRMDANPGKSQQRKKMGQGWMRMWGADDFCYYFQGTWVRICLCPGLLWCI